MKYLKTYNESIFSVRKEGIIKICKEFNISNYTINEDLSIDVKGDVDLSVKRLTKLPLKFNNVSGYFYCDNNELTSLEGCPTTVGGFYCIHNRLTSLEGCPTSVGGDFFCNYNKLTSLEGCPTSVGGNFLCYNNELVNLYFSPKEPDDFTNNPCTKLYKDLLRKLKVGFVELNFRLEEFEVFKDNKVDEISLEQLKNYYI